MTKKEKSAFTLAEGGQSPLLYGDEGVAEGYSCVETKGHKVLHASKNMSFHIIKKGFTLAEGGQSPLFNGDEGTQGSPRLVKRAFTLAEILITLGVIGVVAAVTLPTLIHNYKKSVVETKVKKTYALISNAVKMSEAKYGEISEWDRCDVDSSYECSKHILEKYVFPELKIAKICGEDNKEECWTQPKSLSGLESALPLSRNFAITAILNEGTSLYMWAGLQLINPHIQIWFDINGSKKGANMLGADVFGIQIDFSSKLTSKQGPYMKPLNSKEITEDKIRNAEIYGCSKEINHAYAGTYCGGLIQLNGWKIPDDYPVKF